MTATVKAAAATISEKRPAQTRSVRKARASARRSSGLPLTSTVAVVLSGTARHSSAPHAAHLPLKAGEDGPSQRALDGLDLVALDDVALLDVLVIGKGHAAFLARQHLAHFVFEALQGREIAFVDHDVVADQAHLGAAAHQALGNAAAGCLADLADVESL